jgi:two-component system LytT family sensor kinase
MKKSIVIALHVSFWGCYSLLALLFYIAINNTIEGGPSPVYVQQLIFGSAIVPALVAFYTAYLVSFQRFLKRKKVALLLGFQAISAIVAGLLGGAFLSALFGSNYLFKDGFTSFISVTLFMAGIGVIFGALGLVLRGFISWYSDIKIKEELTEKNHSMELALVKSQLDPHFLFNTINNIDVLIEKDAAKGSAYLNKLSDILRFMLFEAKTAAIPLSKEVAYIEKYVDLQKIRTSNENYVNLDVQGEIDKASIAPMLLIPFIENAFKHTGNKKAENAISVRVVAAVGHITFKCENKYTDAPDITGESNGLGNELIARRLNLLYPDKHVLNITKLNGTYTAELTLQT